MATKTVTRREARWIVENVKWMRAPKKTEWGDMVQALIPLSKDDTLSLYGPREAVEKLIGKPVKE